MWSKPMFPDTIIIPVDHAKWSSSEIIQVHPENLAFWTRSWRFGSRWFSFFNLGWFLDISFSNAVCCNFVFFCVCVCVSGLVGPLLHLAVVTWHLPPKAWISSIFYFQRRSCSSTCYTPGSWFWWSYDEHQTYRSNGHEWIIHVVEVFVLKKDFRGQGSLAHPSVSDI